MTMAMFTHKDRKRDDEMSLRDALAEAEAHPDLSRLYESPPDEPGKPEAVNLELDEPYSTGVRRRDSF